MLQYGASTNIMTAPTCMTAGAAADGVCCAFSSDVLQDLSITGPSMGGCDFISHVAICSTANPGHAVDICFKGYQYIIICTLLLLTASLAAVLHMIRLMP